MMLICGKNSIKKRYPNFRCYMPWRSEYRNKWVKLIRVYFSYATYRWQWFIGQINFTLVNAKAKTKIKPMIIFYYSFPEREYIDPEPDRNDLSFRPRFRKFFCSNPILSKFTEFYKSFQTQKCLRHIVGNWQWFTGNFNFNPEPDRKILIDSPVQQNPKLCVP